ncbi:MAG: 1,6-anhydro-N-acetylmuramyl-L-alanine amidase AmpD [Pseudomonadota bacterium]|nr:1,6-anhydro-N-acetylmuramyl-L-alanine amidase AmpD [Pseudomonadota bacterium]
MNLDPDTGLVRDIRQAFSPNQDERPAGGDIKLLVIHAISLPPGQFGGEWVERLFCNRLAPGEHPYFTEICDLKVSAHFLIRRDGELIQFVPAHRRAWHAGESWHRQRPRVNDFSLGIELEGCDEEPFDDKQYATLAALTRELIRHYPGITPENIVGHCDIALGRKTDPGPCFDWDRYRTLLAGGSGPASK